MLALLLSLSASAQEPWPAEFPVEWAVSGGAECCLTDEEAEAEIAAAWTEWSEAVPCLVSAEAAGRDDALAVAEDGVNAVVFAPASLVSEVHSSPDDTDITFHDGVDWVTEASIADGTCTAGWSLHFYAVHAIGTALGYRDPPEAVAIDDCTTGLGTITDEEAERVLLRHALREVDADWRCSHELIPGDPSTQAVSNVPFTLACASNPIGRVPVATTWDFGDGGTSDALDPDHAYTDSGLYDITVCHTWATDTCGELTECATREQYVVACDEPAPTFELVHTAGLEWVAVNNTEFGPYGCTSVAEWDVFDESGAIVLSSSQWEPSLTFPEPGTYRVVLNVGGFAGTGASELTVDIGRRGAAGCNISGTRSAPWLSLFMLVVVFRRSDPTLPLLTR